MKVNNNSVKSTQTTQVGAKDLEKTLAKKDGTDVAKLDQLGSAKINMSQEAQAFQKAKAIASKDSVDEAKVARLQKLIDEGKYKVDSSAVADRLVDEHLLTSE